MSFPTLCMFGLAVWRLSYLLVSEKGPFGVATWLRRITGMKYNKADQLESYPSWNPLFCIYCTSVWSAAVLWLLPKSVRQILAASTLAVLIHDVRMRWL